MRASWFSALGSLFLIARASADQPVPIVNRLDRIPAGVSIIQAAADRDGFGTTAVAVGDVDGDGLEDLAFFSSTTSIFDPEGYNQARILYGSAALPPKLDLDDWAKWGTTIDAFERIPCPIAGLGDLDGDGYADIGFGASWGDRDPSHAAVILFGSRNLPAEFDGDTFFGCRVARLHPDPARVGSGFDGTQTFTSMTAGDFDGDGIRDVVAAVWGRPDDLPEDAAEGTVYLIAAARPFPDEVHLEEIGRSRPGCRITCTGQTNAVAALGKKMAAGDFDRDGIDDLVLTTPFLPYAQGGDQHLSPAVFVLFGRKDWPGSLDVADGGLPGICRIVPAHDDSKLADPVLRVAPDLDGDGVPDLLVSIYEFHGATGRSFGRCDLVSGRRLGPGLFRLEEVTVASFTENGVSGFVGPAVPLPGWKGDGTTWLAFGDPGCSNGSPDPPVSGALFLLPATGIPFSTGLPVGVEGPVEVLGDSTLARLGDTVLEMDIDGDGRPELVATAPGQPPLPPTDEGERRGRLVIIRAGADLLGALRGDSFDPLSGDVAGGGLLHVRGCGLDGSTEVLFAGTPAAVVERPDSRNLIVRIPPWPAAGDVSVGLRRGPDGFVFPAPFAYVAGAFPPSVDVNDLGGRGTTIVEPRAVGWKTTPCCWIEPDSWFIRGGHDFTGDGLADIVFYRRPARADQPPVCPARIFLLHGARDLPARLSTDALEDRATVIDSETPWGIYSDFGLQGSETCAILVGDMDGDGRSELAIGSNVTRLAYIVLGHDIPVGPATVEALFRDGKACRIENIPGPLDIVEAGDIDGDGLRDVAIQVIEGVPRQAGEATVTVGCLGLVLGRPRFPPVLDFADLPRVYGKLPIDGGSATQFYLAKGAGDADGDGFDDILIHCQGSMEQEGDQDYFDSIYLLFGRGDWPRSTTLDDEIARGSAGEIIRSSWGGRSIASASAFGIGDQDGDGKAEIGVMTRIYPNALTHHDSFRVIPGGTRPQLSVPRSPQKPDGFAAIFPASPTVNDYLMADSGGRDFDGDGVPDILIADDHTLSQPPSRAIVLFGGDLARRAAPLGEVRGRTEIVNYQAGDLNGGPDGWANSYPHGLYFGGDIDGDGLEDLVIACMGRLWIYYNPLRVLDYWRPFRRGDADGDGTVDLSDAIAILAALFLGAGDSPCLDAADTDDSGEIDITDPISLLRSLFLGAGPLPGPGPGCGPDPTPGPPGCKDYPACP